MEALQVKKEELELQSQSTSCVDTANKIAAKIKDQESYEVAADYLQSVKGLSKKILEYFKEDTDRAHSLWKSLTIKRSDANDPLLIAEKTIKKSMSTYLGEKERKEKIEQERLLAEQRKINDDAKIAAAEHASDSGEQEKAEAILNTPTVVAPVQIEKTKTEGISAPKRWNIEVVSKMGLIRDVIDGKAPESVIDCNTGILKKLAEFHKSEHPFRGVRAWQEFDIRSRSK